MGISIGPSLKNHGLKAKKSESPHPLKAPTALPTGRQMSCQLVGRRALVSDHISVINTLFSAVEIETQDGAAEAIHFSNTPLSDDANA